MSNKKDREENEMLPDYSSKNKTLRKKELVDFLKGIHGCSNIVIMKHGRRQTIGHIAYVNGEICLVTN